MKNTTRIGVCLLLLAVVLCACSAGEKADTGAAPETAPVITAAPEPSPAVETPASSPAVTPTPEPMPAPTSAPTPEPVMPEYSDPPRTALDVFFCLAAGGCDRTQAEYAALISEWAQACPALTPTTLSTGKIVIPGEDGYRLLLYFPTFGGPEGILREMCYSDRYFEVDASPTGYIIYDITQTPKNRSVSTLAELAVFIKYTAPEKMRAIEERLADTPMLEVTVEPEAEVRDGEVFFTVRTNLPDRSDLILGLRKGSFYISSHAAVVGGIAKSEGFTEDGAPLQGHYTLTVSSAPLMQEEAVQLVTGYLGECMTGPCVTDSPLDGSKVVSVRFPFDF